MKPILIFDYDGTIHNTIHIYEKAFRETYAWLIQNGYDEKEQLTTEQIAGWLGMNSRDMWNTFWPELPEKIKEKASTMVGESMAAKIRNHQAVWYDAAEQTLDILRLQGYRMIILSNCKKSYRKAHWEEFSMQRWFERFYDCESFDFAPKTEIIKEIMQEYPGTYIVIGDRKNDMECATACKSPFIGCLYGFGKAGELDGADAYLHRIDELPNVLEQHME